MEMRQRKERGLWGIHRANGHSSSLEICYSLDRSTFSYHDNGSEITVGISHSNGPRFQAPSLGETTSAYPGERRIPRDVNVSIEKRFDLVLIVRVQHVVHLKSLTCKINFESRPDRYDLGIVGYCSQEQDRFFPHHDFPLFG